MRTIACSCEASFEADFPEDIDLDAQGAQLDALKDGSFQRYECPTCGRTLKPEFSLSVRWPSKGLAFRVVPEIERAAISEVPGTEQVLVGYAELADRLSVVAAGLDPVCVEALKYYLLLKASETAPDAELSAWFHSADEQSIEFHVHGLRDGEVAVTRIPRTVYDRTRESRDKDPAAEPFSAIVKGRYVSVQNLFDTPEE